jgi:HSP90 family molecular chaperone
LQSTSSLSIPSASLSIPNNQLFKMNCRGYQTGGVLKSTAAPKKESAKLDPEIEKIIQQEKSRLDSEEKKEASPTPTASTDKLIEETENVIGESQTKEFQAETKKILDIVARSLYSDKEIYVRELISNASDALEKVRHLLMIDASTIAEPDLPLEIHISVDDKKKTFTIQDYGIGMNKEELVQNLGKIGFSGTSEFLKVLEDKEKATNLIGQFGVGFYSVFMVAKKIKVYSRSAKDTGSRGYVWESDGSGSYSLAEAEPVHRGTKIIAYLKQDSEEFSTKQTIENIVKTYSNFVGFPIYLNGSQVNKVGALWVRSPKEVTAEQHKEFYQFISKAYDSPIYTLHAQTDLPLSLKFIFYVPETHMEKYGMGRQEIGVSLFSRKILIQAKCKGLLPEWLRFIKGVVDSEDVPLNLSREHLQDSALIKRLSGVLTKRLIKQLDKESKDDKDKYEKKFYAEFSNFLKEGICTDYVHKEDIAKLLRMESSALKPGEFTTLNDYIGRMPKHQKDIYYLIVPSRDFAEQSPYFETFKESGTEVLFFYDTRMDDFVLSNLGEYDGKKLKTIESSSVASEVAKELKGESHRLSPEEFADLSKWMRNILIDRVTTITQTDRLSTTPMIIVDHESASFRRMMRTIDPKNTPELPKQQVQVNPAHPIISQINQIRKVDDNLAKEALLQLFDNALIQAGLIDDSRSMVPRINKILERALSGYLKDKIDYTTTTQEESHSAPSSGIKEL